MSNIDEIINNVQNLPKHVNLPNLTSHLEASIHSIKNVCAGSHEIMEFILASFRATIFKIHQTLAVLEMEMAR